MSAKVVGKVWELVLTPAKQTVLLAMADHADHEGGSIKPGVPLLAWKTGYSERQVQRIIRDLEADGLLVPVKMLAGKPTEYRIDFAKGTPKPPYEPRKKQQTPDKMSPQTPDILSPHENAEGVTSHGEEESQGGDIASANLTRIRQKEEPSLKEKAAAPARANIFTLFEDLTGKTVSPLIADDLKDARQEYPEHWIPEAFREAAECDGRSWKYVRAILERWRREGFKSPRPASVSAKPRASPQKHLSDERSNTGALSSSGVPERREREHASV